MQRYLPDENQVGRCIYAVYSRPLEFTSCHKCHEPPPLFHLAGTVAATTSWSQPLKL